MESYSPAFSVAVEEVKGLCPAGDRYAGQQIARRATPVLSCEGACIRGEIARLAANLVVQEVPALARACAPETFFVPHSAMAAWVRQAERIIMIDGCFLRCHGRVLSGLVGEEKVIQFDAHPLYRKYSDVFRIEDVPEEERQAAARQVADRIIATLKEDASWHTALA